MSDLTYSPHKIKLGEVEYDIVFTIKVIDKIQHYFDIAISDLSKLLIDSETPKSNLCHILTVLINETAAQRLIDETIVDGLIDDENAVDVLVKVLIAFSNSLPDLDENEVSELPPEEQAREKINIARLLFIGKVLLGYTEREIWDMTLKKFMLIYTEYQKYYGIIKAPETIEDLIPEGM